VWKIYRYVDNFRKDREKMSSASFKNGSLFDKNMKDKYIIENHLYTVRI